MMTDCSWWDRLDGKTRNELCDQWLPWAAEFLRRRYGEEAEELAGEALFEALRSYNGRVSLRSWLALKLHWTWCRTMERRNGRVGSAKHRAMSLILGRAFPSRTCDSTEPADDHRAIELTPDDLTRGPVSREADPAQLCGRNESLVAALHKIQFLPAPARHLVLGRFLGSLTLEDISHIIGTAPRRLQETLAEVRQSLPLG
ncbi:MAG: hypothetical protein JJU36_12250 [Phycisphaeraceae bacterium]|nr:hypothetical protein [Phycisphaeraceae bacterium]